MIRGKTPAFRFGIGCFLAIAASLSCAEARTIKVGPGGEVPLPSVAAGIAQDGDVVEIQPGTYTDSAIWHQNKLVLKSAGGVVTLKAPAKLAQDKGIWVIEGDDVLVSGISFVGAQVSDSLGGNGAGIRAEGGDLHIIGSSFIENQDGLLGTAKPTANIIIESSEFRHNGTTSGRTHNIYISSAASFTLEHSVSHLTETGHQVKSRAHRTVIAYNYLGDGVQGRGSYEVDIPDGGDALVIGNVITKGPNAQNNNVIAYNEEKPNNASGNAYIVSNTIVSTRSSANFVLNASGKPITIANNLMVGNGSPVTGEAIFKSNIQFVNPGIKQQVMSLIGLGGNAIDGVKQMTGSPGFEGEALLDYRLTPESPALGAGTVLPPTSEGFDLYPTEEFTPNMFPTPRAKGPMLNIGAY